MPFRRLGLAIAIGSVGAGAGLSRLAPKAQPMTPHGVSAIAALTGSAAEAENGAVTLAGQDWDLPNLDHERVDFWIAQFTTDKRANFEGFLRNSGRYAPMILQKLSERDMPLDLLYLAMIESGFEATAYSRADASGLWQFIQETGERYGLEVNAAVDERNDPVKATDAGLDYLQDLYDRFGSWYLASAAYNTGENRVGRIMREETGSERGDEESYFAIWDRLPRETRDYVPLMIAAARIAKDPARYGFNNVEREAPLRYDEVVVDAATPLDAIARAVGTTVEDLRALNTQFKMDRTRADKRSTVRVPEGTRTAFLVNWPEIRERETLAVTPYRVRQGEDLLSTARGGASSAR